MVNKVKVGKKIYALRKKMGITQENLAKMVNVTPQAISKWENGIALPDTCLLPVLSQLFHIGVEELLCISSESNLINKDETNNRVLLPGIVYYPSTPSLVSCIRSCLSYLGIHVSLGWISAPYAFMLNINDEVSFKGPEFWNDNGCFDELVRNCGGIIENFNGWKGDIDISYKRKEAWNLVRDSINKGLPCYAWEMDKPMYYLIAGYDEKGYYYIDPDSMKIAGPKLYNELGESEWGILEIHIIRPGSISDNLKTLKDIFEYAINVNNPHIHQPNQGYTMGTDAYRVWWESVSKGKADYYGMAYNASFWANCKNLATLFLLEGKLRIGIMDDLFDEAISNYKNASRLLHTLSLMFPVQRENEYISQEQREKAVEILQAAQKYEINGLRKISNILDEIYKIW
ncbi:helix-turn-helix transcriptional regulator [Lutispora sp.]|uniref:helix-turn-helix transcriptional regulator n=1 Tax=Lutispora sp. TaxID=2828727 RepID=UPI0035656C2C